MTDTEINEAVARKLGWKQVDGVVDRQTGKGAWVFPGITGYYYRVPGYCHSIEEAWKICEKMTDQFHVQLFHIDKDSGWTCVLDPRTGVYFAYADTAPMAICLSFLKLP